MRVICHAPKLKLKIYFSMLYSVSSLIRISRIRILAYPNSQNQDYNIIHIHFNDIHIHFNDIHIVIELSVIYFSMYFTYQLSEQKYFLLAQRGSDK